MLRVLPGGTPQPRLVLTCARGWLLVFGWVWGKKNAAGAELLGQLCVQEELEAAVTGRCDREQTSTGSWEPRQEKKRKKKKRCFGEDWHCFKEIVLQEQTDLLKRK